MCYQHIAKRLGEAALLLPWIGRAKKRFHRDHFCARPPPISRVFDHSRGLGTGSDLFM